MTEQTMVDWVAAGIWESLIGVTHDGSQPWDSVGMRRYGGTSGARDNVLKIARAAIAAMRDNITPTDLQARMEELVRWMASSSPKTTEQDAWFCEAQDIVAHLPKPAEPDLLEVREILDAFATWSKEISDDDPNLLKALAAYKRIKADRA